MIDLQKSTDIKLSPSNSPENSSEHLAPATTVVDSAMFQILHQPFSPENTTVEDIKDAETATYRLLGPDAVTVKSEHQKFLDSDCTDLPDLRPTSTLNHHDLNVWEQQLLDAKLSVAGSDMNTEAKKIYRWRINENIANLRIIRAAASGDTRRFERYNTFVYGQPNPDIFHAVADKFCSDAEASLASDRPEVRDSAAVVLEQLGQYRVSGQKASLVPLTEKFEAVQASYNAEGGYVDRLFKSVELVVDTDGYISKILGDVAISRMLRNIGSTQEITDANSWSNGQAALYRPPDYAMTIQDFREYLGHELAHSEEYINGINSAAKILATGLDRYERGNEGRAVLIEQILNDKIETFTEGDRWREILSRHLAVSLGSGLANGVNMNYAQNYAVLHAVNTFYGYQNSTNAGEVAKQADEDAASLLSSVYKGTDSTGIAGVYRRPMIYLEGNIDVWKKDIASIDSGKRGKFDVSNDRHTNFVATIDKLAA